jgi:3-oxoadipate enol-lactonase
MSGLHVSEWGKGPPVVVLSGCGCPGDHLEPLARALASDFRVLLPFSPGYPPSAPLTEGYSLERVETMIVDALTARGVHEAALVGYSIGAWRALSIAASASFRATRLVLLGGLASFTPDERKAYAGFAVMARTRSIPPGVLAGRMLSPAYASAHPEAAYGVERWVDPIDPDTLACELDALGRTPDVLSRVPSIDVPIVLHVGSCDAAAPVAKSREVLSAAKDARLEVVEGVGHAYLIEDFEGTCASVRAALS